MLKYIPNVKFATLAFAALAVLECPYPVEDKKKILSSFLDETFTKDNEIFQGVIDRLYAIQANKNLELKPFENAINNLASTKLGCPVIGCQPDAETWHYQPESLLSDR